MKRLLIGFIAVLVLSTVFFGCKDTVDPDPVIYPLFVENAINSAPDDVLVGIGACSNLEAISLSQMRTIAAGRARAAIARQMNIIITKMIRDFMASNGIDLSTAIPFNENITIAISKSTLPGSSIKDEDRDENGTVWCIIYMDKEDIKIVLNEAVANAKLTVPGMDSFEIESSFDEIFAWAKAQE